MEDGETFRFGGEPRLCNQFENQIFQILLKILRAASLANTPVLIGQIQGKLTYIDKYFHTIVGIRIAPRQHHISDTMLDMV